MCFVIIFSVFTKVFDLPSVSETNENLKAWYKLGGAEGDQCASFNIQGKRYLLYFPCEHHFTF